MLTGSQTYELMRGVSESLAGRIGILEMAGLSLRELVGGLRREGKYVPRLLKKRDVSSPEHVDLWATIQRGSMPQLVASDIPWDRFWSSYVQAYLERDVRALVNVKDEAKFYNCMVACAARTGQLLNASDIGNAIDADHKTVKACLSILQASGIVRIVGPPFPNIEKRLTKTPKVYFMDTGLVCHLTRWNTPDQLRCGAVSGHVFETFVVSEAPRSRVGVGADLRDYEVGFGHAVCQTREPYLLAEDVEAVPVWAI